MSITKLFLSVSVIAMFAVGSAWATDPENTSDASDTVATSHSDDIYPSKLGPITTADGIAVAVSQFKDSGIAGVTYVNRMVGVAGGAAQQAENHAAAAGAYAIAAAESADEAKEALDGKVDRDNGETNMFMVTDNEGYVTAGSVGPGLQVANDEARVIIDDASALDFDENNALTVVEANRADPAARPGVVKYATTTSDDLLNPETLATAEYAPNDVLDPLAVHYATASMAGVLMGMSGYTEERLNAFVTTDVDGSPMARKPGDGLQVGDNGVASVNISNEHGLQFTDGQLDVNLANGDTPGVVKQGTTTFIDEGKVEVVQASATVPGVMKWGQIPSGSAESTDSATIWIE